MNPATRRAAIIAALLATISAGSIVAPSGQPVWASQKPSPSAGHSPGIAAGQRAGTDETKLKCLGEPNPVPQYSASNRTLHYGGKITCNYIDTGLTITVNLLRVTGTGDHETRTWEDQAYRSPVVSAFAATIPDDGVFFCQGTTSTRWMLQEYFTTELLGTLAPWPTYTSVYTLPCAA